MPIYAKETTTSVDSTIKEIETTLKRYGGGEFDLSRREHGSQLTFYYKGIACRLPLVKKISIDDPSLKAPKNNQFTKGQSEQQLKQGVIDQHEKQCWRVLLLYVKASLELIDYKLSNTHGAFAQYVILPNGQTFAEMNQEDFMAGANRITGSEK
jgi:hypothetical protein